MKTITYQQFLCAFSDAARKQLTRSRPTLCDLLDAGTQAWQELVTSEQTTAAAKEAATEYAGKIKGYNNYLRNVA